VIVIKNGSVFFKGKFEKLDVGIQDDKIVKIGKNLKGDSSFDASDMLVVPGLIDPHVHLREPGDTRKEDMETGTKAAVAGGFTTVMDMPNNTIPTTTVQRLNEKKALARRKAVCSVLFHFGATDNNFEEVMKARPLSMKVYLGKTTGELYLRNPTSLEKHFQYYDGHFVFHEDISEGSEEQQLEATYKNLEEIGRLSNRYKRRAHIAHASSGKMIEFSKTLGMTVEVPPHYLFLSDKDAKKLKNLGTVYPPLRSEKLRRSLWSRLSQADCIATDHAPHTLEDKEMGAHGFPGLETSLALMLSAYHSKKLKLEWIIERMSLRPAEIFGFDGIGRITEGYYADVSIIDLKKEWKVKGEEQYTKCKWSPFEGKKLKGKAKSVFHKGKLIFDDYEFKM